MLGLRRRPGRAYLAGAPTLVAHRGGAKLAPENTLAAFESAVSSWGADMLEMDVRLTADGEVVVIHDDSVDRTTDGTGKVADLTLAQLRELDAGYRFVDPRGHTSWRGRGASIPTLEEVLDACPSVWINVEAKERPAARPLIDIIRRRGEQFRVLVAAEVEANRRDVRDYSGPWGASTLDCRRFWLFHRVPFWTPRVDVFQVPEFWQERRVLTPALIDAAHRRNIAVQVWTVDDPGDMRRFLSWGIDGIQSDRPDLLATVLAEEVGRPLPPGLRRGRETITGPAR